MRLLLACYARHYFRDNPLAYLSLPLLLVYLGLIVLAPMHLLDRAHPGQTWFSDAFRQIAFFAALYGVGALYIHYQRLISSDTAPLVPAFHRRHYRVAALSLAAMLGFFWLGLWRNGAPWSGAVDLAALLVLSGAGLGVGGGGRRYRWQRWRWLQVTISFGSVIVFLYLMVDGEKAWEMFGDLPTAVALVLAVFLIAALYAGLLFNPARMRAQAEQAEARIDKARPQRSPRVVRIVYWLRWMPKGWSSPVTFSSMQLGVIGTAVLSLVICAVTYGLAGVLLETHRHGALVGASQELMRQMLVQSAVLLPLLIGASLGGWIERVVEWQSIYLIGYWGGRETFCDQVYRFHLRQAVLNAAATGAVIAAIGLLALRISPLTALSSGLVVALGVMMGSYAGSLGAVIGGRRETPRRIVQMLVFLLLMLGLPWMLASQFKGAGGLGTYQLLAYLAGVALLVWGHLQAPKYLRRMDWLRE